MLHYTAIIHPDPDGTLELHLDRAARFRPEVIEAFGPGPVLITVQPLPRKRSGRFNRYYHGQVLSGVLMGLRRVGNDVHVNQRNRQIAHRSLRDGPLYPDPIDGVANSTARLNHEQFVTYVRKIVEAVKELTGHVIEPPPDDLDWIE